jgi:hypothetical protein
MHQHKIFKKQDYDVKDYIRKFVNVYNFWSVAAKGSGVVNFCILPYHYQDQYRREAEASQLV